jgi:hypothetical protein
MIAVRMMEVATDAIVGMAGVRNRLVAAVRAMNMARLMPTAAMVRRAAVRVLAGHVDDVLVDMTLVRVVEVAIV